MARTVSSEGPVSPTPEADGHRRGRGSLADIAGEFER
jgi:hypothetical protein